MPTPEELQAALVALSKLNPQQMEEARRRQKQQDDEDALRSIAALRGTGMNDDQIRTLGANAEGARAAASGGYGRFNLAGNTYDNDQSIDRARIQQAYDLGIKGISSSDSQSAARIAADREIEAGRLGLGRDQLGETTRSNKFREGIDLSNMAGDNFNSVSYLDALARNGMRVPLNNPELERIKPISFVPGAARGTRRVLRGAKLLVDAKTGDVEQTMAENGDERIKVEPLPGVSQKLDREKQARQVQMGMARYRGTQPKGEMGIAIPGGPVKPTRVDEFQTQGPESLGGSRSGFAPQTPGDAVPDRVGGEIPLGTRGAPGRNPDEGTMPKPARYPRMQLSAGMDEYLRNAAIAAGMGGPVSHRQVTDAAMGVSRGPQAQFAPGDDRYKRPRQPLPGAPRDTLGGQGPGDLNGDGVINVGDQAIQSRRGVLQEGIGSRFNARRGGADYDPQYDLNNDGILNSLDSQSATRWSPRRKVVAQTQGPESLGGMQMPRRDIPDETGQQRPQPSLPDAGTPAGQKGMQTPNPVISGIAGPVKLPDTTQPAKRYPRMNLSGMRIPGAAGGTSFDLIADLIKKGKLPAAGTTKKVTPDQLVATGKPVASAPSAPQPKPAYRGTTAPPVAQATPPAPAATPATPAQPAQEAPEAIAKMLAPVARNSSYAKLYPEFVATLEAGKIPGMPPAPLWNSFTPEVQRRFYDLWKSSGLVGNADSLNYAMEQNRPSGF